VFRSFPQAFALAVSPTLAFAAAWIAATMFM
jgi:hypothetical protein